MPQAHVSFSAEIQQVDCLAVDYLDELLDDSIGHVRLLSAATQRNWPTDRVTKGTLYPTSLTNFCSMIGTKLVALLGQATS